MWVWVWEKDGAVAEGVVESVRLRERMKVVSRHLRSWESQILLLRLLLLLLLLHIEEYSVDIHIDGEGDSCLDSSSRHLPV